MVTSKQVNGHIAGSLKYPECAACVAALKGGRHALLVNRDHDECVKKFKEPHIV